MTEHIHTCNYECTKPACVLSQRDELVKRLVQPKKQWIGLTNEEIDIESSDCFGVDSIFGFKLGAFWAEKILEERNL